MIKQQVVDRLIFPDFKNNWKIKSNTCSDNQFKTEMLEEKGAKKRGKYEMGTYIFIRILSMIGKNIVPIFHYSIQKYDYDTLNIIHTFNCLSYLSWILVVSFHL